MRRTPGSPTIRIDPEVGATIFKARLILSDQRRRRVTSTEALSVLLAVNSLHRIGQAGATPAEPDPVSPPCELAR